MPKLKSLVFGKEAFSNSKYCVIERWVAVRAS